MKKLMKAAAALALVLTAGCSTQQSAETPAEEPSADEEAGTSSLEIFSTSVDNEEGGKDYTITVTNTGNRKATVSMSYTGNSANYIFISKKIFFSTSSCYINRC